MSGDSSRLGCGANALPGVQDTLVLGQLPHEGGVGPGDAPLLLDEAVGLLQRPTVLLHGVGNHRGRRAAHTHLAMHQTLGVVLPVSGRWHSR